MAKKPKRSGGKPGPKPGCKASGKPFAKGNQEWQKQPRDNCGRKPRYIEGALKDAMQAIDMGQYSLADLVLRNFAEGLQERVAKNGIIMPTAQELSEDPNAQPKVGMVPVMTDTAARFTLEGVHQLHGEAPKKFEFQSKDDPGSPLSEAEKKAGTAIVSQVLQQMKESSE